jgi:predicted RNase H-like HicB family nuclease
MSQNYLEIAQKLAARPYFILKSKDETTDGQPIFIARTLEIEDCIGQGSTPDEAEQDLRAALVDYIESLLEDGMFVPEPVRLMRTAGTGASTVVNLSNREMQPERIPVRDSYILTVQV